MKKRIASLLMAVLMLVTMLPVTAMAEELAAADPAEEQVVSEEVTTEPTEETDETETPAEPEHPGQTGEEPQPSEDAELPSEDPVEDEPVPLADETDADTGTVTRIAWVQKLVATFDMTVEDDNYPDNYYTDIDSTAAYYRDLMVAVEFGVIDLEAGLPFEPEEPATREFAAHTLNYCLGFQLDDSTYTYADTADVTYKDDVQVAVNRGWFALADGSFLPKQAMAAAEAEAMLADAAAVLEGTVVSETYNSTYTFKTGVIEIPNGTDVQVTDGVVRITDCPKTLTSGCIFVVYLNGLPVAYVADTVTKEGNVTVVTATRAEDADAFEAFDAQGVVEADLTLVKALDGTELAYYVEELDQEFQTYAMAKAAASRLGGSIAPKIELSCKREIAIGNAVSIALDIKVKNPKVSYSISLIKGEAYVQLSYDLSANYQVKGDLAGPAGINDIKLFYWGIPAIGGFSVTYDAELSGSVTGIQEWHVETGLNVSKKDGASMPRTFKSKTFTIAVEATCQVGFQAKFGVTELPALKAYIYAGFGCVGKAKANTYADTEKPETCVHFAAYLYAKCGATGQVEFEPLNYKKTLNINHDIYDEDNSPVRIVHHYEDGKLVAKCARGNVSSWFGKASDWYTSGDSQYMSSGWSSGYGGSGYGKDGTPIVIYEYTTDEDGKATITKYNGNSTSLVIPSTLDGYTVVAIGKDVFKNNTRLRMVVFPDTVTKIGNYAFYGCTNLSSITFGDGLVELGTKSFYGCTSLTAISLPDSVTRISYGAFDKCTRLANVKLSQNLEQLDGRAFSGCDALTSITIPKKVATSYKADISDYGYTGGRGAFNGNANLKSVTFEEGSTVIAGNLLANCPGIETIVIPDSVTEIGEYAFYHCINLKDVKLSSALTTINTRAFNDCIALPEVEIPDSVVKISYGAFDGCTALADVKLSRNLVQLDGRAFSGCDALTSITIPKKVATSYKADISDYGYTGGRGAFNGNANLKSVTFEEGSTVIAGNLLANCPGIETIVIPDSVTEIGEYAFYHCINLKDVKLSSALTTINTRAFNDCIALPEVEIPDSVVKISYGAFDGCTALADVKLSRNLVQLDGRAFSGCDALTSITIPKKVATSYKADISDYGYTGGRGAFNGNANLKSVTFEEGSTVIAGNLLANCPGIETIVIPDSVTEIGEYAFYHCINLKDVKLSSALTTINTQAFNDCSSLLAITVPDSVTSMGSAVFANCTSLADVTLPNTRQIIMSRTFESCSSLEKIVLPETVTRIQENAFENCTALKEIVWSKALTTIDANAFLNCDALVEVSIPATVTSMGNHVFRDCDALTTVVIPDSVTSMGTNVFYDCDALTSVKLGSGITTIPVSTFEHCDVLESIVIPRRVTTIGNTAFKDCVKFTSITIPRSVTSISSNAFSYPAKMTIYGVAGTYAETFAKDNSIKFVAKEVSATAVTLNTTELTISKGASATLFLTVTPEDFTDAVSWKSSNTSVATISDAGVVKAVDVGTATIKVVVGGKSASCKVTVQQPVTGITLNKTSLILEALGTYQLTATANPNTAVDRRISWSSSAPEVASVDENGLVTAHKKGSATITASAMDGSGVTKTCAVTVSNTAYICATVEEMESPHNYPDNCNDFWVYTIPGAEKLLVTFDAQTKIEDGFDYLYAYDAEGNQVGEYTGTELAGKTITIPSDTVRLKLVSDDSGNEWGFKVSSITPGMTGGAVSGNVTTGGNAADPVTIALKQDGSTVKTTTVTGGSYLVSGLTDGTYTLEASKPGCVSRSYTVAVKDGEIVSSLDVVLVARSNINGAAVNGDDVEITDVACLYRYLTANDRSQSSIPDEAYFLAVADVNSDGAVDVYDLQLLYETVSGIV